MILSGNCLTKLKEIPDKSCNCCVTSPPYFHQRDYGVDGQIGLEATPDEYIKTLVNVFREVKRTLKDDGTLWINIWDSYASSGKGVVRYPENVKTFKQAGKRGNSKRVNIQRQCSCNGIKPKDLIGIPWMLAFALRADGWYLRQDIIWHKPNPIPESVTDRCTKSHEYIFLLSKSQHYYFDQASIKEPASQNSHMRISKDLANRIRSHRDNGGERGTGPAKAASWKTKSGETGIVKNNSSWDRSVCLPVDKRNKRSVWTVTTRGIKEAHFATFPIELIEPCILAGCPEGGTVVDPFLGSRTTGQAAKKHRRNFIGIELNPEYVKLAAKRSDEYIQTEIEDQIPGQLQLELAT